MAASFPSSSKISSEEDVTKANLLPDADYETMQVAVGGSRCGRIVNLPYGYKFAPTNKEIVFDYLLPKILGKELPTDAIKEKIDLYNHDPEQLPQDAFVHAHKKRAYFFTCTDQTHNQRRNTLTGYWLLSREEEEVFCKSEVVGFKKTFFFHRDGVITNWKLNEYRINPNTIPAHELDNDICSRIEEYVACRIRLKENTPPAVWVYDEDQEDDE